MDCFTIAYVEALFFTEDELLSELTAEDFAPESWVKITADCARFQTEWEAYAERYKVEGEDFDLDPSRAGHDFWLTRNHHGAGFWDGDWPEPWATKLDALARSFGEAWPYVGDDGRIYL